MGNLIMNGNNYGNGSGASMAYVGQRTLSDKSGNNIHKIYMRIADWDGIGESIIELEEQETAGFHNSIFRGRDITPYYENGSLYTKISSGKFTDLFVGDYFKAMINGNEITCRIAGFDVFLHNGYPTYIENHHVVIVPDEALMNASMNDTNVVGGGFKASKMCTTTLKTIDGYLQTIFGEHLLQYRELISHQTDGSINSMYRTSTGAASSWEWNDMTSMLMSEVEVFGAKQMSSSGYDNGIGMTQLPLFRLAPEFINAGRFHWWLRAVVSSTHFATVDGRGKVNGGGASDTFGVRPRWILV